MGGNTSLQRVAAHIPARPDDRHRPLFPVEARHLGRSQHSAVLPPLFAATAVPAIGFYDGIFGPGTGSFFMLAFVMLAGHGLLKATAHTKTLNFASNIGAFAIFAESGAIDWKAGLAMGAAQFFGARTGAHFAMNRGAKIIKPLLVTVCFALALRLLLT